MNLIGGSCFTDMRNRGVAANHAVGVRPSVSFGSALQQTIAVQKKQDTVDVSGMTFDQKLEWLKQQHNQTDYSHMSYAERWKTIEDRLESVFPFKAIQNGLFGAADDSGSMVDRVIDVYVEQLDSTVDLKQIEGKTREEKYRKAMYGDLSKDEVKAEILKKYGSNSYVDRASALGEMMEAGLFEDNYAPYMAIREMEKQLKDQVCDKTGRFSGFPQNHNFLFHTYLECAANTKVYFSQIADSVKEFWNLRDDDEGYQAIKDLEMIFSKVY